MGGKVEVKLSTRPDGYGFYYGEARLGHTSCRVNVLPPVPLWDGDMKLENHQPDPEHSIIYVDGEEIARVKRREDLGAAMVPRLTR